MSDETQDKDGKIQQSPTSDNKKASTSLHASGDSREDVEDIENQKSIEEADSEDATQQVVAHSDYQPSARVKDEDGKLQLTGMYQNWFLDYASYVILERAVPHLDDGLKPVQRRILHTMKLLDDGRYNKVANVVGQTMQFHPHGDASIGMLWYSWDKRTCLLIRKETGEIS